MTQITIERVDNIEQCHACRAIVEQVWGAEDTCSAAQMFVHATYGGVLLLAHAGRQPVGSLFSFPSLYRGEWVLWSHETAVLPEFLHQGIGYQLKLMQRQIAAEMGYQSIAWTFDPLVSRNAHFNMNKLGASIAEYKVNVYGTMENDLVEQGLPSDRWIAVWPVATVVSQGPTDLGMRALEQIPIVLNVDEAGEPRLNENSNVPLQSTIATRIPKRIDSIIAEQPERALDWRIVFRQVALTLMAQGYRVAQFHASEEYSTYIWLRK